LIQKAEKEKNEKRLAKRDTETACLQGKSEEDGARAAQLKKLIKK
jgi:hypothetical protein